MEFDIFGTVAPLLDVPSMLDTILAAGETHGD
jgi:hypothetical protein